VRVDAVLVLVDVCRGESFDDDEVAVAPPVRLTVVRFVADLVPVRVIVECVEVDAFADVVPVWLFKDPDVIDL
jgi:hypothetical protein